MSTIITETAAGPRELKFSTSHVDTRARNLPTRSDTHEPLGPLDKRVELQYFQGEHYVADNSRYATFFAQPDLRTVTIRNLRDVEGEFSLDKNGFELHHYPTKHQDFSDDASTVLHYHEECHELIKKLTGARYFLNDNHLVRTQDFSKVKAHMDKNDIENEDNPRPRGPARFVHVDQSYKGAKELASLMVKMISHSYPEVGEHCAQSPRFQILTVWRPLRLIQRDPLAVADFTSVSKEDLVPIPVKIGTFESESYKLRGDNCEAHKWYYVREMRPDEVLVFKTFDSADEDGTQGIAKMVPHTAFVDPEYEGRGLPPRESIEFRTIAFY